MGTRERQPPKLFRRRDAPSRGHISDWIRPRRGTHPSPRVSTRHLSRTVRRTKLRPTAVRTTSWSVRRKKLRSPRFYTNVCHIRASHERERIQQLYDTTRDRRSHFTGRPARVVPLIARTLK
jgi:hypothetical protein